MTEKVIEFEVTYGTATFSGYAFAEDLDDDEPLYFYDRNYGTQTHLSNAHIEGNEEDREKLVEAFCEDFMFIQFLHDFQDDSITIDRIDYTILINGGSQLEIKYDPKRESSFSSDTNIADYMGKITFDFNNIELDDYRLNELQENIEANFTDAKTHIYRLQHNGKHIGYQMECELPRYFFNPSDEIEEKEVEELKKDIQEDIENAYVKDLCNQVELNDYFYDTFYEKLVKDDDSHRFDAQYILDATKQYFEMWECSTCVELNNKCIKEWKEDIHDYIYDKGAYDNGI